MPRYYVEPDANHPTLIGHVFRTEEDGPVELGEDVWLNPAEAAVVAWALEQWSQGCTLQAKQQAGTPGVVIDPPESAVYETLIYDGPKP